MMLKKVPVIKSMMAYSKLNNNVAMTRSAEIARLARNISKKYSNYKYEL